MQEKVAHKKYMKQSIKNGLHWHCDVEDLHLSLRFAGKPAFVLEKLISIHGEQEGKNKYKDFLLILKSIGDENFSPFVLYINNKK